MSTLLALIGWTLLAAFFSASETGAYRLNRIRLRHRADSGSILARMEQVVVSNMERFVCLTLIAHNAAVYGATVLLTARLEPHFERELTAEFMSTLILAPVLLICAEVVPKSVFNVRPDQTMRWSAPFLWIAHYALWPVVTLFVGVVTFWRTLLSGERGARPTATGAQHLDFFLEEGRAEGAITPQQDQMVRNILDLGLRPVRRIMIPIDRALMIPVDAPRAAVLTAFSGHDHRRLAVYAERRDNVIGTLRVLDYLSDPRGGNLKALMHAPVFIPVEASVNEAFRTLQKEGQLIGILRDPRNRALGIVTMTDILQEIFATIQVTESDVPTPPGAVH